MSERFLCAPPRCLGCMRVLCYRAVTLMALLTEAFFSPAWLNSNGLRFDFPPVTRQERATHRHTRGVIWAREEHAGRRTGWRQHTRTTKGPGWTTRSETDTETTWMITWLMSLPMKWDHRQSSNKRHVQAEVLRNFRFNSNLGIQTIWFSNCGPPSSGTQKILQVWLTAQGFFCKFTHAQTKWVSFDLEFYCCTVKTGLWAAGSRPQTHRVALL